MHSISALMLTNVQAADQMICRLGDLLRISLDSVGTQITTLRHELEFVTCYLDIEKVRFEDRLQIHYAIAPEMLDAQVPAFPAAAACRAARSSRISRLPGGGGISSLPKKGRTGCCLRWRTTASQGSPKPMGTGVGLKVTRERLQSLYGEFQSLDFRTSDNRVRILISIPLRLQPTSGDREPEPALQRTG